ncbi:hypothetical protein PspLS_02956 [Pyricularia sp. CBS 133598]|nr:hypothetical protein PspLS_02956 [Pyricularia sp. CBS 133598]
MKAIFHTQPLKLDLVYDISKADVCQVTNSGKGWVLKGLTGLDGIFRAWFSSLNWRACKNRFLISPIGIVDCILGGVLAHLGRLESTGCSSATSAATVTCRASDWEKDRDNAGALHCRSTRVEVESPHLAELKAIVEG